MTHFILLNTLRFFCRKAASFNGVYGTNFQMGYKVSTTPSTPQNVQDLGVLVAALVGAKSPGQGGTTGPLANIVEKPSQYFVLATPISPTSPPPYTINITPVLQPGDKKTLAASLKANPPKSDGTGNGLKTSQSGKQNATTSPSQPVDCSSVSSSNPCTFTRNFPVDDKEYWDVSLGLAIPGPKENVFKGSSSGVPTSSVTTHTDAYAFADFYLFAKWRNKQSLAPHINGGIPITSQSLHRPYVGLSEDISGWAQRHGFPLDVCVFGGIVFMKQQLYDPAAHNQLRTDWAHKAMYGVEVPISSIASKLSGKGNKSNAKSTGQ